jgi:hypothetical protein
LSLSGRTEPIDEQKATASYAGTTRRGRSVHETWRIREKQVSGSRLDSTARPLAKNWFLLRKIWVQRFVTGNPTPAHVARISAMINDQRGDEATSHRHHASGR